MKLMKNSIADDLFSRCLLKYSINSFKSVAFRLNDISIFSSMTSNFDVRIVRWHGVANWTWNGGDEVCVICHASFDDCHPEAKFPGDDSPVVWGTCNHAFHTSCIVKWLDDHGRSATRGNRCPICRKIWEFKVNEVVTTPTREAGVQSNQP